MGIFCRDVEIHVEIHLTLNFVHLSLNSQRTCGHAEGTELSITNNRLESKTLFRSVPRAVRNWIFSGSIRSRNFPIDVQPSTCVKEPPLWIAGHINDHSRGTVGGGTVTLRRLFDDICRH